MDFGYQLKRIDDLMHKDANNMLEKEGVTFSQHHVLVFLAKREDRTATLKEIEKFFKVSQATMAGIVKRLEEKGFVKSYYKENDKRIKYVSISKKGEDVCKISHQYILNKEKKISSLYSKEELEKLEELLTRLYMFLESESSNEE